MKVRKFLYSQKVAPYVFVLPFILSFCFFWIYPLCSTITMSFQDILPTGTEWIGLKNYKKLLIDTTFHQAIMNSFEYMLLTIVLLIPFPMAFAVLMDSRLVKAKGVWKAFLYLPALTSVVISGTLFRLMFSEYSTGQLNVITSILGLGTFKWLKVKATGLFALVLVCCWRWTGVNMLYFLSGLKSIDGALYESAEIDGASGLQKFRFITIPLLKPTTIYVLTISIYAGLAMFMESFMLWAGPDSPNNIGLTIVGYLYKRGIAKNQLGYGSAVGLVLLVIALFINVVQLVLSGTFKKEEK
ncbi:carbohydrate ABC transporter membrane protein 1 (CUT1 family) [Kineothrix alysoides]|uniref:Carbohydrate ABC transporter membrane protein 1 (CUT1 family) n=1 Tax=Kineothrix alysoides TaxID=1469948 RepID=A0A4R1QM36_9FIRM|nr:sugar ABC transporter permease [Kineothrix alysoides]TCL54778.1 carbohydrate ABC transporter membrane protein 1 (CUT1 family) [Kineothrix alysoides]